MRRLLVVVGGLTVFLLVGALPAHAQEADLEAWFEAAGRAEYSGRQVTVCETPDGERAELVDVAQREGVLLVDSGSGSSVVSRGELYDLSADGSVRAAMIEQTSAWQLGDRYRAELRGEVTVVGRPADVVAVVEGDRVRLELAFDRTTGAVLRSVAFNGDGSIYCTSSFLSFSEAASFDSTPAAATTAVLAPITEVGGRLPDRLAGFERKDVFEGPGSSTAAFYSDGIFSFTVLVTDRPVTIAGLEEAAMVTIDGGDYQRIFFAGQAFYSWTTKDGGYVMLGDHPLDLQEAVLAELPAPGRAGFFTRFWRRLFG